MAISVEEFERMPQLQKDLLPAAERKALYQAQRRVVTDREAEEAARPKQEWQMTKAERQALKAMRDAPSPLAPVEAPAAQAPVSAKPKVQAKPAPAKVEGPVPMSMPTITYDSPSTKPVTLEQKQAVESYLRQKYLSPKAETDTQLEDARARDLDMGLLSAGARLGRSIANAGRGRRNDAESDRAFAQEFQGNEAQLLGERQRAQDNLRSQFAFERQVTGAEREDAAHTLAEGVRVRKADPNSQESVTARQVLAQLVPNASKLPNFTGMTAAQIDERFPQFGKAADQELERQRLAETRRHNIASEGIARAGATAKGESRKTIPANEAASVGGLVAAQQELKKLHGAFQSDTGFASALTQWFPNSDAKQFKNKVNVAVQVVGRILEGGKLAEGDLPRYQAMMPQPSDSQETAQKKVETLISMLEADRIGRLQGLNQAGYDTSGFSAQPQAQPQAQEVERLDKKTGKVAVFDGQTKAFIRWK